MKAPRGYGWEWGPFAFVVGLVVVSVACGWLAIHDVRSRAKYAAEHHCVRTGNTRPGYTYFLVISCGENCTMPVPMTTPDRAEFACDDGHRWWW